MKYLALVLSMLPGLVGMIRDQIDARIAARSYAEEAAVTRRSYRATRVRRYLHNAHAARHHRSRLNRCNHSRRRIAAAAWVDRNPANGR